MTLRLRRDFGYGAGTQIRGTFSIRVSGPETLERVVFLLDDAPIGEDIEAPFSWQFRTENYSLGLHTLSAVGYTNSGEELRSNTIVRNFVSGGQANNLLLWIIVPIVVLGLGGRLFSSWITNRGRQKTGKLAISGAFGGTICPNCGRSYAIHWWSFKLIVARLDRCPHCGKWKMVNRMPQDMLEAAEEAWETQETAAAPQHPAPNTPKKLQDQLDDSRFEGS